MSYLKALGLEASNYDKRPSVPVDGYDQHVWKGWEAVTAALRSAIASHEVPRPVVAVECYSGVLDQEVAPALRSVIPDALFVDTAAEAFKSPEEIERLTAPWLGGDDPIFGFLTRLTLEDFLDETKCASIRARIAGARSPTLVYGPGALLCCNPDVIIYADMARWEAQRRQRDNRINNLGVENAETKASLQYKRSFFVDWRVCDKLKRESMGQWDFLLDTCEEGEPKLITGEAFRAGLSQVAHQPFRVVPFFDPGVWGGQWMREVCDLPDGPPNYAWCFDCVPEENSLLLDYGGIKIDVPALNLVLRHPLELLGEPVYGRFGAEFPIRFDLLDTMQGQNLSFQVHPTLDFAREHFGLSYTQDESYYILDADREAIVYLGVKDGIDPESMMADLRTAATDPQRPFPDEQYVAHHPAKRHDHFLIPAGTCHCSGAGSLVLEISHTPYIFTFKLWDWARLDLNGQPRPLNLKRGAANLDWSRTDSWVKQNLINTIREVDCGQGWREEQTGLYRSQFIETRRHWFTGPVQHDTRGESVHVLNLVQGAEAVVESPVGHFAPLTVHFAETFIIPAAVGPYTIRPTGAASGHQCATVKAYVRVNP